MYAPFTSTIRLYAGWLLAWYFLIEALGAYSELRDLPFHILYVRELFLSPIIFLFAFAAYLYLLLTSLHRWMGGGFGRGVLCILLGIVALALAYQYM